MIGAKTIYLIMCKLNLEPEEQFPNTGGPCPVPAL